MSSIKLPAYLEYVYLSGGYVDVILPIYLEDVYLSGGFVDVELALIRPARRGPRCSFIFFNDEFFLNYFSWKRDPEPTNKGSATLRQAIAIVEVFGPEKLPEHCNDSLNPNPFEKRQSYRHPRSHPWSCYNKNRKKSFRFWIRNKIKLDKILNQNSLSALKNNKKNRLKFSTAA